MTERLKGINADWNPFALQLGLEMADIQEIDGAGTNTAQTCFSELLQKWIQLRGHDANIKDILNACESCNNKDLIDCLKKDEEMCLVFPGMWY